MFEIIMGTLIAFLTIVGMTEIFHWAAGLFFRGRPGGRVSFLVTSHGHDEQLEYTVRSLMHCAGQERFFHEKPMILVVDNGMDPETRKVCDILAREHHCLATCRPEQLPELLGPGGV